MRILRAAPGTFAGFDASAFRRRGTAANCSRRRHLPRHPDVLQAIIGADGRTRALRAGPGRRPALVRSQPAQLRADRRAHVAGRGAASCDGGARGRPDDRLPGRQRRPASRPSPAFLLAGCRAGDRRHAAHRLRRRRADGLARPAAAEAVRRAGAPAAAGRQSRCRVQSDERQAVGRSDRTARRRRSVVGAVLARRTGGRPTRRSPCGACRAWKRSGSCSPRPCIATIVRRIASGASCASSSGWRKSVPMFAVAYPRRHELLPAVADAVRRSR